MVFLLMSKKQHTTGLQLQLRSYALPHKKQNFAISIAPHIHLPLKTLSTQTHISEKKHNFAVPSSVTSNGSR